ncbi:MAG: TonB-dependent receptor [Caulobacterales bacterium]|nr:TonB-dependent receptor [Caulobacterales bacterium]
MSKSALTLSAAAAALFWAAPSAALAQDGARNEDDIIVTARRVEEDLQSVPIPVSVVSGQMVEDSGSFNVNRLKELIPTVQFYSSNPRNSAVNIRGLGAPFGLTNDGIEPGVGFYVDGVFYARPAVATLDFLDTAQIEVLRGPQGTLYGKNTTAGAINITTRRPSLTPEAELEASFGDYGYTQARGSITGPIAENLAGRLSFSSTHRDGFLYNTATQDDLNDLNNVGVRGQLLFTPTENFDLLLAADYTRQRPEGYAQVYAGVAPTLRAANRQYAAIVADLGYIAPSTNPFDRVTDADTPHRSYQDVGGVSLTAEWDVGVGELTSISAWRFWDWDPSNDRDFLGLPVTTISANPSEQRQWSQEIRYAGEFSSSLSFVTGLYAFKQTINSEGLQEQGSAAARFLLAPTAAALTPGLLDGYGQTSDIQSEHVSAAIFGQLEWAVTDRLRILPGLRFNYDNKEVDYDSQVYGGLVTVDPALIALQRSVLAPQSYAAEADDTNLSGQITIAYDVADNFNAYATYATSFKSVGLNLGGLPTDAGGAPILDAATVDPEEVRHIEIGFKSEPWDGARLNFTIYETTVEDYQAQVVNANVGVLRGYLANADEVRVRGAELDFNARVSEAFSIYGALAYTDGEYVSFTDAPAPLEGTGGPQAVDISGERLPGISAWAGSIGGEFSHPTTFLGREGEFFIAADASYRSDFSSSATPSRYLVVDGYGLLNGRVGFRASESWAVFLWGRNITDEEYFEFLSAAPGGSGLYVGYPGDPRTYGVTLRRSF